MTAWRESPTSTADDEARAATAADRVQHWVGEMLREGWTPAAVRIEEEALSHQPLRACIEVDRDVFVGLSEAERKCREALDLETERAA